MFSYLGYGERAGSGLYMISSVWKDKNWIKPEMEDELNPNRTILTLYMKKDSDYPNNYPNHLTDIQLQILEIMKSNPSITVKQISELVSKVKYNAIRWNVAELKRKEAIERKGTTRKGQWIIKKLK